MLLTHSLVALLGLPFISASCSARTGHTSRTVNTTSGPVSGHAAPNASTVSEYLGVPFGKSTAGSARFLPPERFTGTEPINGTNLGFRCVAEAVPDPTPEQLAAAEMDEAALEVYKIVFQERAAPSEDCLNLNIWAPTGGKPNKPVILLVYGGGSRQGSNSRANYNGEFLAEEQDVIVVVHNYRLGIFGFPQSPSKPNKNVGFLDTRLAIEWVRDNIAGFGGDPSKIVLLGSSAGGSAADLYTYAHPDDPIVSGFLFHSGVKNQANTTEAKVTTGEAAWLAAAAQVGCNGTDDAIFTCMQNQPADIIQAAQLAIGITNFLPTPDNITVFTDYEARNAAGAFARVPVLMGTNDYEFGFIQVTDRLAGVVQSKASYLPLDLDFYQCPANVRAKASVDAGVPTWKYRYFGDFPNTRLAPYAGAWHTSELMGLLGLSAQSVPSTPQQIEVFRYMRGAWAAFARDPKGGLSAYGWPEYRPDAATLVRLAYQNSTGLDLGLPAEYAAGCPV